MRARFNAYQTGAYVQATSGLTSRLDVSIGGRVDNYDYLGATRLSPRASASYRLTDRIVLNSSYGRYYQQPVLHVPLDLPAENRALVPWRADHFIAGVAWQPARGWRVTAEAYRKNYRDYPVALEYPSLSLANVGDTFNVREVLFPMASAGRGYAEGIDSSPKSGCRTACRSGERRLCQDAPRGPRRRAPARLVRLSVRRQCGRRISAVGGMVNVHAAVPVVGAALHAGRCRALHRAAARSLRSERQRASRSRRLPLRRSR